MLEEHGYYDLFRTQYWYNGRRVWLYSGRACLYDTMVLVAITFCLQCPRAAHALRSDQFLT
jgi:hypothetical protein